jgi:c-di-GMP-binding flagellar brake protein YcgR
MTGRRERRDHPRYESEFAVQLAVRGDAPPQGTLVSQSRNLSLGGIYCRLGRFIPVLTKMQLTLLLPFRGRKGDVKTQMVRADAVVVRTSPEEETPQATEYEIACAFLSLDDDAKKTIARFIRENLETQKAAD